MGILGGLALSFAGQVGSPLIGAAVSESQIALGINTLSRDRFALYRQQRQAAQTLPSTRDNQAIRLGVEQIMRYLNTYPWHLIENDANAQQALWEWVKARLSYQGINMSLTELQGQPWPATLDTEPLEWFRLIDRSAPSAPLEMVMASYRRGDATLNDVHEVLSRLSIRRKEDRDTILNPYYQWGLAEANKLFWMGEISRTEWSQMIAAAGIVRDEDQELAKASLTVLPDAAVLMRWASRNLWDTATIDKYELDDGFSDNALAQFFAKATGIGSIAPNLDGQPTGSTEWLRLAYREMRKLPTHEAMIEMQRRIRLSSAGDGTSVIQDVAAWEERDTRAILQLEGYSPPIIDRMVAMVTRPADISLIGRILPPILENPEMKAMAQRVYGAGYGWVKSAFLDHGYDRAFSELAAKGIEVLAIEASTAEMRESQKQQRHQDRANVTERYALGLVNAIDAKNSLINNYFTFDMADEQLRQVDMENQTKLAAAKLAAIQEAYMKGSINYAVTGQQLTNMGIVDARKTIYLEQWQWERTGRQKILATTEVKDALKQGIIQPGEAIQRLTNLGWVNPDAVIEIQLVQAELAAQQAKAAATAAAHAQAQQAKATAAAKRAAAAAALVAKQQAAAKAKLTSEQALALHQKLRDQSKYFAAVHLANSDYAKASAAGDQEKMDYEIQKEVKDYQQWLIDQQSLINEGTVIAHEIGPLSTTQAAGPAPSTAPGGAPGAGATPPK